MALQPTRGLYLYLETLRIAFDDAIVTDDEAQILHILAQALGVAPADTAECRAVVAGEAAWPFDEESEYEGHQLIWKSNFDEKSKLMKIGVTYSRMNDPEYEEELAKALQEWWDAESRGEDMDELIRKQFDAGKDHPNKPTLAGFIPAPKGTLH